MAPRLALSEWIIYLKILQNISVQNCAKVVRQQHAGRTVRTIYCRLFTTFAGVTFYAFLSIHLISKIVIPWWRFQTQHRPPRFSFFRFLNPFYLFPRLILPAPFPIWPLFLLPSYLLASCLMEVFPCSPRASHCYSAQVGLISCYMIISHWQQFETG